MRLIYPSTITNEWLTNSNVAENDHAEWDNATEYDLGDFVIVTGSTHKVYESVQATNTGNDPTTDDGSWWAEIGATNRWKAFDGYLADKVSQSGSITYEITVPAARNVDGIAVFGPTGSTVTVSVINTSETEIYNESFDLADPDTVFDWLSFWKQGDTFRNRNECVFENVPGSPGYVITVTIDAGAETAEVAQVIFGRQYQLGITVEGTETGIEDYSRVERDEFGRASITRRDYAKLVDYEVRYATDEGNRLIRLLGELRATPAVYYDKVGSDQNGTTVFGLYKSFKLGVQGASASTGRLEIEGLT
jgi:hypothetical protein